MNPQIKTPEQSNNFAYILFSALCNIIDGKLPDYILTADIIYEQALETHEFLAKQHIIIEGVAQKAFPELDSCYCINKFVEDFPEFSINNQISRENFINYLSNKFLPMQLL